VNQRTKYLEDAASQAKLGFWEYNQEESRFHWSDVVYEVFGLEADTALKLETVAELYGPDSSGVLTRAIELALQDAKPFSLVSEIETPSGQRKWIRTQGQVDDQQSADSRQVVGTIQDISEIRQLDRVTQESEMTLNQVEQITHIGRWSVGLTDGSVYHSDEIKRIFGYEPSEYALSVEDAINAYHPDDRDEVVRLFNKAVETGEGYEFDLRIVQPSGDMRFVHSKGYTEQDETGTVTRVYGIFQDVTERKEMEERLHQSEKMKAIGQLAGGVAHDFNNQLTVILNFASLIKRSLKEGSAQIRFVDRIIDGVSRSADLTSQLLAFARKGKYVVSTVDMNNVISEVVSMVGHSFDKKIKITHNASDSPATISGDVSQLQNALLNLALNSRDAMPDGGELIFSTSRVILDEETLKNTALETMPGECLRLMIRDNGEGMDATTQTHIFEPFFTTKEQGRGTGMGMASVYGTVKNHHGAIEVESKVGEGTTITIHFPLVSETTSLAEEPITPVRETSGQILIVDDEEGVAESLSMLLDNEGYATTTCSTGRAALDEFEKSWKTVDLVLLDMIMPDMNGVETFHAMKAIHPDVRVVLLSGFTFTEEARRITDAGAAGFLPKPVAPGDLLQTIADVLGTDAASSD